MSDLFQANLWMDKKSGGPFLLIFSYRATKRIKPFRNSKIKSKAVYTEKVFIISQLVVGTTWLLAPPCYCQCLGNDITWLELLYSVDNNCLLMMANYYAI